MERIAVVDYGMGNLHSVAKALDRVSDPKQSIVVSSDPAVVEHADRVVFPGQGAMRDCIVELKRLDLRDAVLGAAQRKPFLGICIGLQALLEQSEEHGGTDGLGVYAGGVLRFPDGETDPESGERLKIPHMGWNQVRQIQNHTLWNGIGDNERFYFVHSYYAAPSDQTLVAGKTHYAVDFTSAIARDNVFAVQFHPEKSQRAGLTLLENFLRWQP